MKWLGTFVEDRFTKSLVMITGVGACMIQNLFVFVKKMGSYPGLTLVLMLDVDGTLTHSYYYLIICSYLRRFRWFKQWVLSRENVWKKIRGSQITFLEENSPHDPSYQSHIQRFGTQHLTTNKSRIFILNLLGGHSFPWFWLVQKKMCIVSFPFGEQFSWNTFGGIVSPEQHYGIEWTCTWLSY